MGLLSTIGAASARAYGFTRSAIAAAVDAYFNRVTLLLPGNGTNGAQNNTFLDSSSNNFSITRNGNATQGTFSPFSQTGWGNYFSSGNYISVASNAAFAYGTGAITIEFWHYSTTSPTSAVEVFVSNGSNNLNIQRSSGGFYNVYDGTDRVSTTTVTSNQWNHVAFVRQSGGQTNLYVNGTSVLSWTSSVNYGNDTFVIAGSGSFPFPGYISNMRVLKGTAQYTSSFTPPTSSLTAVTNTSLLTCQSNRFVDNSASPLTLTITGTPSVQAFSPFAPTAAYSAATVGGSAYSDGSGDYLTIASNANLTLGSSDFTIELWWYPLAFSADGEILTMASTGGTNRCYAMYTYNSNGTLGAFAGTGGSSWDIVSNLNMGTAVRNAWNHMAFTRSGSTFSTYLNGVRVATTTATGTLGSSGLGVLANNSGTSQAPNSYISGVRTIKGTALYTGSTYTVPTAPPTTVTNTNLLLNFTNGAIADSTGKNVLETVGNAQVSTTQSKFGGSSMYFDGTGDYLKIPSNALYAFGTGPYTIEFWIYPNSLAAGVYHVFGVNATNGLVVGINNAKVALNKYGVGDVLAYNTALSTSAWSYVAIVREGTGSNQTKIYVNGTSVATGTDSNDWTVTTNVGVGANTSDGSQAINAYLSDLRITKGYARTITASPTAAFPKQ